MSTHINGIDHAAPQLPAPTRVGQGTAVEQTRAVAEVHAAIVVARQCPRDMVTAQAEMKMSCNKQALAKKAFYRYSRGDGMITGASVHLARELARCFGNIQHGIVELLRDDVHGQSEMQAWAWDVERNTRSSNTFIVPHKRDTKTGVKVLTDLRDVYENNTNMASRRLREAIFSILPPWFVEDAKTLCRETIEKGVDGQTLPQRIAEALAAYERGGIVRAQLEIKVGRPTSEWIAQDVADLEVIYESLRRGETSKNEEFPPAQVTAAEIIGDSPPPLQEPTSTPTEPPAAAPEPAAAAPADDGTPARPAALREIAALMSDCGITAHKGKGATAANNQARFAFLSDFLGVPVDGSTKNLTAAEADRVITHLKALYVQRRQSRAESERAVAALFDGLDADLSAEERMRDVSIILQRQVTAPTALTDAELADLLEILSDCAGQATAWDAAVQAARPDSTPARTS